MFTMKHLLRLLIVLSVVFNVQSNAVVIGSDMVPSRESAANFPAADSDNTMLGFAAFANGFTLEDNTTTCTFNDFLPVQGTVNLNGGTWYLRQDVVFNNILNFNNIGHIYGNNYTVEFTKNLDDLQLPSSSYSDALLFNDTSVLLNADTTLNAPMHFRGDCLLCGRGNQLVVSKSAPIVVRPEGHLTIKDLVIMDVGDNNIRCLLNNASITFQNCQLVLSRDYSFTSGAFVIEDDVLISGTNKFIYSASRTSTIAAESTFMLDHGVTFSYDPSVSQKDLIYMQDATSNWYMNGATLHAVRTGLELSQGMVLVDNKVTWSSEAQSSPQGILLKSDLAVKVLSGATFNLFGIIETE